MRAPRALLFALLTTLACTPVPPTPVAAETPRPPAPPPAPVTVTVTAAAPGRDALTVEHDITVPLEQALARVPGLTRLRSVSRNDLATLVLTLAPGTASNLARSSVHEQLALAHAALPVDISPELAPDLGPRAHALHFVLTGDLPATQLSAVAGRLRSDLDATPGVAAIDLCGGREPRLQIVVDPARLGAHALGIHAIIRSLTASLRDDAQLAPGLQARIAARSLADLSSLVVTSGLPAVTLGDLARISIDADVPACDAIRLDGGPAVLGTIHALRSASPGDFNQAVQARLTALRATLPPGLELRVLRLERVALERLATTAAETLPLTARAISTALTSPRTGYLQGPTRVAAGVPVELELLLEPADPSAPADTTGLAATLATIPELAVRAIDGDRVTIQGDDLETAARIASELATLARKLPGIARADVRWAMDPELALDLDREHMARFGVAEPDLRALLTAALGGVTVGAIAHDGATIPVQVQLGDAITSDPAARATALADLPLPTAAGPVPLSQLVRFRLATQPHAIVRSDRRRAVEVELQILDPAARAALQTTVAADLRLPPGYVVRFD